MSDEEIPLSKQDQLAIAIAQGKSIAAWARENQVPTSTAYGWASDPDSAARSMTGAAAPSIGPLAGWPAIPCGRSKGSPISEKRPNPSRFSSGRSRAILFDQMAIAKQANLEYRMAKIEEKLRARTGNANPQR